MTRALAASEAPIDGETLQARLIELAGKAGGLSSQARADILAHLKLVLAEGRAEAEVRLKADGKGSA